LLFLTRHTGCGFFVVVLPITGPNFNFSYCLFVQQIDAVSKASLSIMRSSRLKKVFEVTRIQKKILWDSFMLFFSVSRLFWHLATI